MNPGDEVALCISLMITVIITSWLVFRYLATSRKSRAELAGGNQYRALADEYRRLSDVAITAQEHVDLRLTDLSVRMDELRDQIEQMQRILKEVE